MGVRKLFRGLTDKFPFILSNCKETLHQNKKAIKQAQQVKFPILQPNLNGQEFHNLYIDLNGLIHQCYIPFREKNQENPLSYEEIFSNVTDAIDRLIDIVRPRVLLYIAIDGPAPLAKQQQQRQRRFFQARNEMQKKALYDQLVQEAKQQELALQVPPYEKRFDSNVISPGSQFLCQLADYIRDYIEKKISSEEWRFRVVFSDAQVPGEGEHKIMRFIRSQKEYAAQEHHANMHHVIYGMDADLIFLTLGLHEPHTTIIRESAAGGNMKRHILDPHLKFKFLHIYVLREYLGKQFVIPNSPFQPNFERMINDFILICAFLGNDFLPKLPTLDISNGALEVLFSLYASQMQEMGEEGYLVKKDSATFNPRALERFLQRVTSATEHDYVNRTQKRHESKANQKKHYKEKQQKLKKKAEKAAEDGDSKKSVALPEPNIEILSNAQVNVKFDRACKHYNTPKGCARGRNCPYVHLNVEKSLSTAASAVAETKSSKENGEAKDSQSSAKAEEATSHESSTEEELQKDENGNIMYPRNQEVFVGRLPRNVQDKHLHDIFKDCGTIVKAVVVVNPFGGISKGFGFVTFDSKEGAKKAQKLNGKVRVDGKKIIINPAERNGGEPSEEKVVNDQYKDFQSELAFRQKHAEKKEIMDYEHPFGDIDQKQGDEALDEWKDRYYKHHCDCIDDSEEAMEAAKRAMVKNYIHGLQFVIQYYLQDIPSWSYFYEYHRAPFASEIHSLVALGDEIGQTMDRDDRPFRPLDQLLSILPIASNHALPKAYRELQTGPLRRFYPEDFPLDLDVRMHWEAHPLLPFMRRSILDEAISKLPPNALTEEEQKRNQFHQPRLYVPVTMKSVPFSLKCMSGMSPIQVATQQVFQQYAFTLKTPSTIFSDLLPGVLPTTWKKEKKVSFKFRSSLESNDVETRRLRDQLAQMQRQLEELKKQLKK